MFSLLASIDLKPNFEEVVKKLETEPNSKKSMLSTFLDVYKMANCEEIELMNSSSNDKNSSLSNLCPMSFFCEKDTTTMETEKNNLTKQTLFENVFLLPIDYLEEKKDVHLLSKTVAMDLELNSVYDSLSIKETNEKKTTLKTPDEIKKNMYDHLFQPSHLFAKQMTVEWGKKFSSNVPFLQETQTVIRNMKHIKEKMDVYDNSILKNPIKDKPVVNKITTEKCENMIEIWKDLKEDEFFLDKYGYMDWTMLLPLNENAQFLQCLSIVNLMSPLSSLLFPVFIFLFPFLILKMQQIPIDFQSYLTVLKEIAKDHFIGKMFHLNHISFDKIIYLLITMALYVLQIYQNIKYCFSFYQSIQKINSQLYDIKDFLEMTTQKMNMFLTCNENLGTYSKFHQNMKSHVLILEKMKTNLSNISSKKCIPILKINDFGYIFKSYYDLHSNPTYDAALRYAFGFEGYYDNLLGVYDHLTRGNINPAFYYDDKIEDILDDSCLDKNNKNTCIKSQYYPSFADRQCVETEPVKNDCLLKKNMIITGVNASGKTTFLKTTTLNVLFSQQIGCGFYENMSFIPYTHIHSYINIPDTSDRDSLFQSESRRCKEILDSICEAGASRRHFCIFDELYSGTNPEEASKSAYAFLLYLCRFNNIDFILTTHYNGICKKLANRTKKNADKKYLRQIENHQMGVLKIPILNADEKQIDSIEKNEIERIVYTYKIKEGICEIQGALQVLRDLKYPLEIVDEYLNFGKPAVFDSNNISSLPKKNDTKPLKEKNSKECK